MPANTEIRRRSYPIFVQLAMVGTMLALIGLFSLDVSLHAGPVESPSTPDPDPTEVTVVATEHRSLRPPPPPAPLPPTAINDLPDIVDDLPVIEDIKNRRDVGLGPPQDEPPPLHTVEDEGEEIFEFAETMPSLIGGVAALHEQLRYPEMCRRAQIQGTVTVQFVVDRDGNVVDPRVLQGIGGGCDEAALEAVKRVHFSPGLQRGQAVPVRTSLQVRFRLR